MEKDTGYALGYFPQSEDKGESIIGDDFMAAMFSLIMAATLGAFPSAQPESEEKASE